MSLTKNDVVESMREKFGITRKDSVHIFESVFDIIKSEFEKGSQVNISGFGKWSVKAKKKRRGRNPQTGESLTIDARKVITFRASPVLRDKVNSGD